MKANFVSLNWEKGYIDLVQGIKNHNEPSNAIAGANGTFVCAHSPKVILEIKTQTGITIQRNILSLIKKATGRDRMSEKLINKVRETLEEIGTFDLDSSNYIIGLYDILKKI